MICGRAVVIFVPKRSVRQARICLPSAFDLKKSLPKSDICAILKSVIRLKLQAVYQKPGKWF